MSDERDSAGSMSRQVPFAFPARRRYDRASYYVSQSNTAALDFTDRWPRWPSHAAIVYGGSGCGKTHLLHIWAARAQAATFEGGAFGPGDVIACPAGFSAALDDADRAAATSDGAQALFHLLNRAQQEGGFVLMTGGRPPALWRTDLPDLRTRLAAAPAVEIAPPDDALMEAALTKSFADHQLVPPANLIAFLATRLHRDFSAVDAIVQALDRETLGTGKMPTFELAGRLIERLSRD